MSFRWEGLGWQGESGRRKRKAEVLPWYRARGYKGKMTEAEKRELDAFRMLPKHPAAHRWDLPQEVQNYITKLELEIYDQKQDRLAGRTIAAVVIGVVIVGVSYFGRPEPTVFTYIGGVAFIIVPWFVYRYFWKKNADEFMPLDDDNPGRQTDEGIIREWELEYLGNQRRARDDDN